MRARSCLINLPGLSARCSHDRAPGASQYSQMGLCSPQDMHALEDPGVCAVSCVHSHVERSPFEFEHLDIDALASSFISSLS